MVVPNKSSDQRSDCAPIPSVYRRATRGSGIDVVANRRYEAFLHPLEWPPRRQSFSWTDMPRLVRPMVGYVDGKCKQSREWAIGNRQWGKSKRDSGGAMAAASPL